MSKENDQNFEDYIRKNELPKDIKGHGINRKIY